MLENARHMYARAAMPSWGIAAQICNFLEPIRKADLRVFRRMTLHKSLGVIYTKFGSLKLFDSRLKSNLKFSKCSG